DMEIPPLSGELNDNTKKIDFIAKNNPSLKFNGTVLIQGDKRIPFAVLEKIMYTCGQAGYSNISLAVFSSE
ncbi:MAG: biopolymer transporter ExbD, partial [Deltaproteobacteria bacterium]